MIVYIASYPRSGNFWTQSLIANQFKRPIIRLHTDLKERGEIFQAYLEFNRDFYEISILEAPQEELAGYKELAPWMAYATFQGHDRKYKVVLPGCVYLRQPQYRKILSEDSEVYFIKTHLMPYSKFFDGEYVVQPIRNAGASIWSYYLLGRDVRGKTTSLTETIRNGSGHGNWSDYHRKWREAAEALKSRYLQVRYEDLANRELEFCDRLQEFLSLPMHSRELKSFDFYHKFRPQITRKGKAKGWEENYSKEQLHLLWETHGEMMKYYGYSEPNYDLGLEQELY